MRGEGIRVQNNDFEVTSQYQGGGGGGGVRQGSNVNVSKHKSCCSSC